MNVAGFVLTGGSSSRMGSDKALLPFGSQTLCEHIGDIVSQAAGSVLLAGHPDRYAHLKYRCIADLRPGFGPLSGLETALSFPSADLCVIVSCDVFNLDLRWLQALLSETEKGPLCVVAEDAAGKVQPLCGVYRHECLPTVSRAISQGRLRLLDLLPELNARVLKLNEIVLNLNTPEQYRESLHVNRGK